MRKIALIIVSVVMLSVCSNCSKQRTVEYEEEIPVFATDTIVHEDTVSTALEKPTVKPNVAIPSSRPSSRHHSVAHDNMRGFDPASEDDMDDNGMSRYFENNDDEGWD